MTVDGGRVGAATSGIIEWLAEVGDQETRGRANAMAQVLPSAII
jgi:hypothetical protein